MPAVRHHYVSQFYLKRFSRGTSEKPILEVVDFVARKRFAAPPDKVAFVKHFNTIDVPGYEPDAIEKDLSGVESELSVAVSRVCQSRRLDADSLSKIIYLMALYSNRNPGRREAFRDFQERTIKQLGMHVVASKETWAQEVERMRNAGAQISENVTYEQMKKFLESGAYSVDVANERQIEIEFEVIESAQQLLSRSTLESIQ